MLASGGDPPAPGGGGRSGGGRIPGGSALAFGERRMEKPVGDWKPVKNVRRTYGSCPPARGRNTGWDSAAGPAATSIRTPVLTPTSCDMHEAMIDLPADDISHHAWTHGAINLARHIGDEDDEDWLAFRAGPLYIPPAASGNSAGVNRDRAPPSGGAE
ncbi:hypothetical protein CYMTET_27309 [Cymbomonas tetramitiformis]|uniref:Uncharacterized protein n=1 Tax=Cymbomonas tetramitiformis TaxID=36881 RepID=A0AAE0FRL2_9CHLO|nr:hypothetical protein CYMTET_27309 [Cymbomonas tetramitiformis]